MISTSRTTLLTALVATGVAGAADAHAAGRPDLTVPKIAPAATSLAPKAALSAKVTVANRGRASGRSVARLVLSRDGRRDRSDVVLARAAVRALRSGKRVTLRLRGVVPGATRPGRLVLLACADDARKVRESRETNNCRASALTILGAAAAATGTSAGAATAAPAGTATSASGTAGGSTVGASPETSAATGPACEATDVPDLGFVDADCDGIDGTASSSVFVSASGADGAAGTQEAPLRTISAGIAAAKAKGVKAVLVSAGQYAGGLVVENGISVYGGYAPDSWQRAGAGATLVAGGQTPYGAEAARAEGISSPTTLQRLSLIAPAVAGAGGSSYGLRAVQASRLRLEGVAISAGAGKAGITGKTGTQGAVGAVGKDGGSGSCDDREAFGKGGEAANWRAGAGGDGGRGLYDGLDGNSNVGGQTGGFGGLSGFPEGEDGHDGGMGWIGNDGADGEGGAGGSIVGGRWSGTKGKAGATGEPGWGGPGGGGGGGQSGLTWFQGGGNGGGGGGAGGAGGQGGTGGTAGGGSFGLLAVDSHGLEVVGSTIKSANGGAGGAGAKGGPGGTGGAGGKGGTACLSEVGEGGAGGKGGTGGAGGEGAGGAGGPSYAIYGTGGQLTVSDTALTYGTGGSGGLAVLGGKYGTPGDAAPRKGV